MTVFSAPGLLDRPVETRVELGDWVVVVFDNSVNTIDEVFEILIVATECDAQEAAIETWEVDQLGRSVVHYGDQAECERAAGVIATIGIRVEVSREALDV